MDRISTYRTPYTALLKWNLHGIDFLKGAFKASQDYWKYTFDTCQRSLLFWDVLRERGDNYLKHVREGQPPVLIFDYEIIIDAREFEERPVNYALTKIIDRRKGTDPPTSENRITYDINGVPRVIPRRRRSDQLETKRCVEDPRKTPIVVIDPRAGHGPGIGGSKLQSEIGIALQSGRPVYFVMFYTHPMPGQTLEDVEQAEVKFLEEVVRRHPEADKPVVIGNCQAGWAAALLGADRPDLNSLIVMNGAPLSYYAVKNHPMRTFGGLIGPRWALLMADMGGGLFDGAHLVSGFERLNPANTIWSKLYNLWSRIDTERERFLDFERWWGGFFLLTKEEMKFIMGNLFVGNKLERGQVFLQEREINLRNLESVVVFASEGDNITPPGQALAWISEVYASAEDIQSAGNTVIYIVEEKIGHLAIFVSAKVAEKTHGSIINGLDVIKTLSPGLYEMVIVEEKCDLQGVCTYRTRFEERRLEDIRKIDPERDLKGLTTLSEAYDNGAKLFETYLAPLVRAGITPQAAEFIRQLHPLRMERYMFSSWNPWMLAPKTLAPWVKAVRRPADNDNIFVKSEKIGSDLIVNFLNGYRDLRDALAEGLFEVLYNGNPVTEEALRNLSVCRTVTECGEGMIQPFKDFGQHAFQRALAQFTQHVNVFNAIDIAA